MSRRGAIALFWAYVICAVVFLTFPGVLPFNRVLPLVLGMPFVLGWVALWVALAFFIFSAVDRALERLRGQEEP
jgi:hypothetical protein